MRQYLRIQRRARRAATLFCLVASAAAVAIAAPLPPSTPNATMAQWQAEYRPPGAFPFPDQNPFSPAKAALGRMLFFDPILSRSRSESCATCHQAARGWSDGRARATGDDGMAMALHSPTLLNLAWGLDFGWDGKFKDIESVAFAAITGPHNMNLPEAEAIARLAAVPAYAEAFKAAFGDGAIGRRRVEMALATYERTIVSPPSPFDAWIAGDRTAIGAAAERGFALFNGRARCASCHGGWAFTDGSFHDIGTARGDDLGRGARVPGVERLRYAFKVPTLRDIARRAPFMHDGSVPTLAAVIGLYDRGGINRPSRSSVIKPLGLTAGDKDDLLAFLTTLGPRPE